MHIFYSPADREAQEFDYDYDDLSTDEAEDIESVGGSQWDTFGEWDNLVDKGGFRAWRAVLWVMLRRTDPNLAFESVRPRTGELRFATTVPAEPAPDEPSEPEGKSETGDESTDSP